MLVLRKYSNDRKSYIEVHTDGHIENPLQDWDWLGHVALSGKYAGYGTKDSENIDVATFEGYARIRIEGIKGGVRVPVYAYDHSGISFSTGGYNDPWDSGQAGWAWVDAETVRNEFHGDKEKAREHLLGMVRTLDAYAQGECYGYEVYDAVSGECIDSCWGFFHTYDSRAEFLAELADTAGFAELADARFGEIEDIEEIEEIDDIENIA